MSLLPRLIGLLPVSWIRGLSRLQWRFPWLRRPFEWVAGGMRHQDGTIRKGLGKGLKFNPGPSNAGYLLGSSEPGVQQLLSLLAREGMVVYDGGSNVGFIAVLAARVVGPSGRVVCFEPLPSNADWIEHNARLNGFSWVTVRREALAGTDGEAHFGVSDESTRGRLKGSVFAKSEDTITADLVVPVRSIDGLRASGSIPAPDLVKLDVEGAEADVLRGGRATLRESRPVLLIELHDTVAPVAAALADLGYHGVVVGSSLPLAEAPWNAYVAAVPSENTELVRLVDSTCPGLGVDR